MSATKVYKYEWPGTDNLDRNRGEPGLTTLHRIYSQPPIDYTKARTSCPGCWSTETVDVEVRPGFVRRDCTNCLAPPLRYRSGQLVDWKRSQEVRIAHFVSWVIWNGMTLNEV